MINKLLNQPIHFAIEAKAFISKKKSTQEEQKTKLENKINKFIKNISTLSTASVNSELKEILNKLESFKPTDIDDKSLNKLSESLNTILEVDKKTLSSGRQNSLLPRVQRNISKVSNKVLHFKGRSDNHYAKQNVELITNKFINTDFYKSRGNKSDFKSLHKELEAASQSKAKDLNLINNSIGKSAERLKKKVDIIKNGRPGMSPRAALTVDLESVLPDLGITVPADGVKGLLERYTLSNDALSIPHDPNVYEDGNGRYQEIENTTFSAGGGGCVSLARNLQTGQVVVMKKVYGSMGFDEGAEKALAAEKLVHDKVDSVNVLKSSFVGEGQKIEKDNADDTTSTGFANNYGVIFMEYVDGVDGSQLSEKQSGKDFPSQLNVAIGAANGIAAYHKAGLVHRDINPKNLMIELREDNPKKIIDSAHVKVFDNDSVSKAKKSFKQENQHPGTKAYRSPTPEEGIETHSNKEQEALAKSRDVYAYSLSMIQIFTGCSQNDLKDHLPTKQSIADGSWKGFKSTGGAQLKREKQVASQFLKGIDPEWKNRPSMNEIKSTLTDMKNNEQTTREIYKKTEDKIKKFEEKNKELLTKVDKFVNKKVDEFLKFQGYNSEVGKEVEIPEAAAAWGAFLKSKPNEESIIENKSFLIEIDKNRNILKSKEAFEFLSKSIQDNLNGNQKLLSSMQTVSSNIILQSKMIDKPASEEWSEVRSSFLNHFCSFVEKNFKETSNSDENSNQEENPQINSAKAQIKTIKDFSSILKKPKDEITEKEKKINTIDLGRIINNFLLTPQEENPNFLPNLLGDKSKAEEFKMLCNLFSMVSDVDFTQFKIAGELKEDGYTVTPAILGQPAFAEKAQTIPATICANSELLFNALEKSDVRKHWRL